jgi:tetratricopeptide (TPR) repeat protein
MSRRFAAVILTAVVLVALVAASRFSVRSTIVRGNKALGEGNAVVAEARYLDALRRVPDSGAAAFNLGRVAYDRRQYPKASEYFERSARELATPIEQAQAYYNLGNILFESGSLQEAREAFKSALRLNPSDDDARYNFVFVDRLLRRPDSSGGSTDAKPLTQQQAEQLLDSLGRTALRMPRPGGATASPTSLQTGIVDK